MSKLTAEKVESLVEPYLSDSVSSENRGEDDLASLFDCVLFGESESISNQSSSYEYDLSRLLDDRSNDHDDENTKPKRPNTVEACASKKRLKTDEWCEMAANSVKQKQNEFTFHAETTGLTQYAREHITSTALSAFSCIFDDSLIELIVANTRASDKAMEFAKLDLLRLVGVLLARALFSEHIPVRNMWSVNFGVPYIAKFMSKNRYMKIMSRLQFDDEATRVARTQCDRFAMMSHVWDKVWTNSRASYEPTRELCVDELVMPCRVRSSFLQHATKMKYGLGTFLFY